MLGRRLWLRPLVATATAGRGVERVNLGTLRTRLGTYACRCDGGFAPATDVDVDLVHRPVPPTVAGEVQNQAVSFAFGLAGAAADHLHVESGRQRRPQHGQ